MFLLSLVQMKFAPENVVLALNCGGFGYQSPLGFKFLSDDYYFGDSRTGDYTYS